MELKAIPHVTTEGLRTDYEIPRVIEEIDAPRQLINLLPDPSPPDTE